MLGRKALVIGIILIMTMAVVPVYALAGNASGGQDEGEHGTAANNTTAATNTTNVTMVVNVTMNATGLQRASKVILHIVDRLANYTESLMANSTNVSDETVALFNHAEELRKEAWALYNNGSYKDALRTAIIAMKDYKRVIVSIRCGAEIKPERPDNATIAKVEALRMRGYFLHVEMLINAAKVRGLNVTNLEELYNETRDAYKKVAVDAMNGNTTALNEDLPKARELKRQLDQAIKGLMGQFLMKHAHGIVTTFTVRLDTQIWALEKLQNIPGINASAIQNITQQLIQLRQNVSELVREGKIKEALQLIRTSLPDLRTAAFRLRWIQKHEGMYWPVHGGRGHWNGHGHH